MQIADYAFKGDGSLTAVSLGAALTDMGKYVFYGCDGLTVYCESESVPETWNVLWNASFRPVIGGCFLWEGAVMNFGGNADAIENGIALNGISAPYRAGYTFAGWSTTEGGEAEYLCEEIMQAANGTKLYAVWVAVENQSIGVSE